MPGIFRFYAGSNPVDAAALTIEAALRDAVSERGRASLMVSGGRSPKPLYAVSYTHLTLPTILLV